jgi:4-alpha-glucanotransferase
MSGSLAELCASHGIEPRYLGIDGQEHAVAEPTLQQFVDLFGLSEMASVPPAGIQEALAEASLPACYVPPFLKDGRTWGITCQVPSLESSRHLGMGDFRDLAEFCRIAAREGADFVGVNPLHAMFWNDPGRISPFSPSSRRFLNAFYISPEWVEDGPVPSVDYLNDAAAAERGEFVDFPAAVRLKERILRDLFERRGKNDLQSAAFREFCRRGGPMLERHALFETISGEMVRSGYGAGWPSWPEEFHDHASPAVTAMADAHCGSIDFHLWLQFQADRQLARVQRTALEAGMRIGLYVDFAVGEAPDGSAAWSDPSMTLPTLSIGAPPDDFSLGGQDWGLAPVSPVALAATGGDAYAASLAAVVKHAGAVRIDHAMSLARLWLIPRGNRAVDGAYIRYPLSTLLRRVAEVSNAARAMVIGEDLGVVPPGFRGLMARSEINAYKLWFFDREAGELSKSDTWPAAALACVGTHDTNTFAGWWTGHAVDVLERIEFLAPEAAREMRESKRADMAGVSAKLGDPESVESASLAVHARIAGSPCRLAALQIEDALGMVDQVNIPGTVTQHPNWQRKLPVTLEALSDDPRFRAHCAIFRERRPK